MPKNIENVKEDILLVTRELLKETGYTELNIRKIASTCGIATGTLYNYYSSKNEIISEILQSDWNLMLRRIDHCLRTPVTSIEKINVIYNQLQIFMNSIHGRWFQTYPANTSDIEFHQIKERKVALRQQLIDRLAQIVDGGLDSALCEIIARLLLSYSSDSEHNFSEIEPSLEVLLNSKPKNDKKETTYAANRF